MRMLNMLLSLVMLTNACHAPSQHKPRSRQILRLNFGTDPPSLDPRKLTDNVSAQTVTMYLDGLTRMTPAGKAMLSLAESYELSKDGRVYTFKLRQAQWSDGTPLTAHQFENTWKTCLDPAFPSQAAFAFYCIKNAKLVKEGLLGMDAVGIRALNESTLQVELTYPNPHFLELISTPYYYPYPEEIAAHNLAFLDKKTGSFISLGPFSIESYKPQHRIVLNKNASYWDQQVVRLDTLHVFFISDQNTELSMYEQGEIDWAGSPCSNLPTEAMPSLKTRDDFHSYKVSGLYYYAFNTKQYPFNNANIRKALTLCINREALIEHVLQNDMEPATRLIPTMLNPTPTPCFLDGNVADARKLFKKGCEELGITPNTFPTLSLSYNTGLSLHYKVVQAIQQQWKESLGVHSHLETLEWKVYLDAINRQNFQVARLGVLSLCSDPSFFLELFAYERGFGNHTGWYRPEFENLFIQSQSTFETNQRKSLIQQAEELFLEEMPIVPLFFYTNSYLKKEYVKDMVIGNNGFDFKWAYID
jgi:oligopeptide transport system substrate-binding protein